MLFLKCVVSIATVFKSFELHPYRRRLHFVGSGAVICFLKKNISGDLLICLISFCF